MSSYDGSVRITCPKCGGEMLLQRCGDGLWYANSHFDLLAFTLHGESIECEFSSRRVALDRESMKATIDKLIESFREISRANDIEMQNLQ